MKKFLSLILSVIMIVMLASCGSSASSTSAGDDESANTQGDGSDTQGDGADTQGASTDTQEDSADESTESSFFDVQAYFEENDGYDLTGVITELGSNIVTVRVEFGTCEEGDLAEGIEMTFDVSQAETYETDDLFMTGAGVEVVYIDGEYEIYPAVSCAINNTIEQQASIDGRDSVIYGTFQYMDDNVVDLIDETGVERQINISLSHTVSASDLTEGDPIAVTYFGTIFETDDSWEDTGDDGYNPTEPMALKIVSLDVIDSEEAQENYVVGDVVEVYNNAIELETSVATFTFRASLGLVSGVNAGDQVRVYYEPPFGGIAPDATRIEPEETQ